MELVLIILCAAMMAGVFGYMFAYAINMYLYSCELEDEEEI